MKKGFLILSATLLSAQVALANSSDAMFTNALGGYDFVAPSTYQTSEVTGPGLGAIVFETSTSTFKGYSGNSLWTQLSPPSGASSIFSSQSNQKIMEAQVSSACVSSATSWLPNGTAGGADGTTTGGQCQFSSVVGFTATPSCVITPIADGSVGNGALCTLDSNGTNDTTNIATKCFTPSSWSSHAYAYRIICMGI